MFYGKGGDVSVVSGGGRTGLYDNHGRFDMDESDTMEETSFNRRGRTYELAGQAGIQRDSIIDSSTDWEAFEGGNGNLADRLYDTGGDVSQLVTVAEAADIAASHVPPTASQLPTPIVGGHKVRRESIGDGGLVSARYIGSYVEVENFGLGVLRYVGPSVTDGEVVCGIDLDEPIGNCDGSMEVSREMVSAHTSLLT